MEELKELKKYFAVILNMIILIALAIGNENLSNIVLYSFMIYGLLMLVFHYIKYIKSKENIASTYSNLMIISLNMIAFLSFAILCLNEYKEFKNYLIYVVLILAIINIFLHLKILSKEKNLSIKEYTLQNEFANIVIFVIYAILAIIANKIELKSKNTVIFIMIVPIIINIFLIIKRKTLKFSDNFLFSYIIFLNLTLSFNISNTIKNEKMIDFIFDLKTTLTNMYIINVIFILILYYFVSKENKRKKEIEEELALQEAKRMIEEEKNKKE